MFRNVSFPLPEFVLILLIQVYFLKQLIREKFLNKFQKLETKFKQSEFIYLLIYRFIGGIPWQLSCLLPTLFNVKVINFFFATLIGIIPQIFLAVSIGSGLEKIIDQNAEVPGITDIIFSPDIYVPLTAFFILILITIFLRKFFYRNQWCSHPVLTRELVITNDLLYHLTTGAQRQIVFY